jgi:hypothetical protein
LHLVQRFNPAQNQAAHQTQNRAVIQMTIQNDACHHSLALSQVRGLVRSATHQPNQLRAVDLHQTATQAASQATSQVLGLGLSPVPTHSPVQGHRKHRVAIREAIRRSPVIRAVHLVDFRAVLQQSAQVEHQEV